MIDLCNEISVDSQGEARGTRVVIAAGGVMMVFLVIYFNVVTTLVSLFQTTTYSIKDSACFIVSS